MEVAGLVLGVLPLLIAAAESYSKVYDAFTRFRTYGRRVHNLVQCLDIQKTIFETESELLLASTFGVAIAKEMLNDSTHPHWKDKAAEIQLEERLGQLKSAIITAASTIRARLTELETETAPFDAPPAAGKATPEKHRWHDMRRQFRFTFSDSRIKEIATSVRELTQDYRTLRSLTDESCKARSCAPVRTDHTKDIEKFQNTQKAAQRVYEALAAACTKHTEHHAYFSLQPNYKDTSPEVRFNIAFRQVTHGQSRKSEEAFWFIVESMFSGTVRAVSSNAIEILPGLNSSFKRPRSPSMISASPASTSHKRVRFWSPSPKPSSSLSSPSIDPALPNLCTQHNFCTRLQSSKSNKGSLCIGWLEDTPTWKHRVFLSQGPCQKQAASAASDPIAFTHLLSSRQNGSVDQSLPLYQRVRLARQLATAMLSFYATPWLSSSSWNSRSIMLYGNPSNGTASIAEPEPFIDVAVRPTRAEDPDDARAKAPPFIRNVMLFTLGVMLLELAFERPIREMQRPVDVAQGQAPTMADYNTAFRQSRTNSSTLGQRFSEIIQKCLYCDFAHGDDLSSPGLQEGVYREVVCELARLEDGFRALQIS